MAEEMEVASVEEELDLSNSDVVARYKVAADIANKTLQGILTYAKPEMRALDLCAFGDSLINQQCDACYKSKKIEKGVAFPTCVSVNEIVCHYSPLTSESTQVVLKAGDMVKVDLGVHIDGYIAVSAHTFIVRGAEDTGPVTGRAADLMVAAYTAAEAAMKTIKPGATNADVTAVIKDVAEDFGVNTVQGVLMHQMKRFIIDGNQVVIQHEDTDQKVDTFEFEEGNVYTVDVVMSTGEGKPIQRDARTTVFKRSVDQGYRLKMKASRYVFSEVTKRFSTFPFSLRALEDEKQARMGVVECLKHDLLVPYPVLYEKQGDLVAHFKFTILLLSSGTSKVTGMPLNMEEFQTDKTVRDSVKAVLSTSSKTKSKKKKNKKKKAAAGGDDGTTADMETD